MSTSDVSTISFLRVGNLIGDSIHATTPPCDGYSEVHLSRCLHYMRFLGQGPEVTYKPLKDKCVFPVAQTWTSNSGTIMFGGKVFPMKAMNVHVDARRQAIVFAYPETPAPIHLIRKPVDVNTSQSVRVIDRRSEETARVLRTFLALQGNVKTVVGVCSQRKCAPLANVILTTTLPQLEQAYEFASPNFVGMHIAYLTKDDYYWVPYIAVVCTKEDGAFCLATIAIHPYIIPETAKVVEF